VLNVGHFKAIEPTAAGIDELRDLVDADGRAGRGLGVELSPRARGLVEQMGEIACDMWRATADAYADRAPEVADHIESLDDELDELHVMLTAEIASGSMSLPVAIEAALVARFYDPSDGAVLVDGHDLRAVTAESLVLAGIAVYGPRNAVDKVLKGATLHA